MKNEETGRNEYEVLIEELVSNIQRLEEMEAARKEEERKIAELERLEKLLTDIKNAIQKGQSDLSELKPRLQEFLKLKDERIANLQREIEAMENNREC